MIAQISGKLIIKRQLSVIIDVSGISYEIMVPPAVMTGMDKAVGEDGNIRFLTYHYYQMDPSKAIPVLVGFLNEIEKEFFESFITVSGVGPKAACRALSKPFSVIASAIDKGDIAVLKSLPGIGEQKAREIVAKLQNKIGKFGLIKDSDNDIASFSGGKSDIKDEAVNVLLQLRYKRHEAERMVEEAFLRSPGVVSCEEILNEVYKGRKVKASAK